MAHFDRAAGPAERISLVMRRANLEGLPERRVVSGYSLRLFRRGEEELWARVETAAGEFGSVDRALERFRSEFGAYPQEMERRCLLLEGPGAEVVGTTTAWYSDDFQGGRWGRIHWVGVSPGHQGRGLGRLLVVEALRLMRRWHDRAYLTTQTTSWVAIHLYLDLGFRPLVTQPEQERGWELLRRMVPHPAL